MFTFLQRTIQSILPRGLVGDSLESQQRCLLRLLSASFSQNLSARTLIENLAVETRGSYAGKLRNLSGWMAAESSLSAALAQSPGVLSDEDRLALQCGIETGNAEQVLQSLLDRDETFDDPWTDAQLKCSIAYTVLTSVFLVVILTFFMLFIVPTLEMMFEEFDVRLPLAMSALILVSEQVGSVLAFLVVPIILIGLMFLFSESLRRTLRYSFLSRWLPSQRANRRAALLRVLSVPVELEQPLEPTLTAAAQFHPDARCRTRLLDVRRDSRSTDDVWHQLARRGFLTRHQTEQIQQITSPTLRAWTLRTLAAKLRFRAATRRDSLTRLIQFAPVLLLGLLVGWIAYAAIGTLYDLVLNLA